jgi:hypothetical protein
MSLDHVTSLFLEITGRSDLDPATNTAWYKNAYFYINAGQRYLDKAIDNPKSLSRRTIEIGIGGFCKNLYGCRIIKSATFANNDGGRALTFGQPSFIRTVFPALYATLSTSLSQGIYATADELGTPTHWMPIAIGLAPEQADEPLSDFHYGNEGVLLGDHWGYKGISIYPAAEAAGTLSIVGKWNSPKLTQAADKSYWTEEHPDILVMAAAMKVEAFYRNSEGLKDYKLAINDALAGIDYDMAEESSNAVKTLEGMDDYGPESDSADDRW